MICIPRNGTTIKWCDLHFLIMNKRVLCVLVILLAVILVVTPAAAGIYSTRMPNSRFSGMNSYSQGMKNIAPNIALLSAVQSKNYVPGTHNGVSNPGTTIVSSLGDWDTLMNPAPIYFGCGCGCS